MVEEGEMQKEELQKNPESDKDENLTNLAVKDALDKIGFGFSSQQFINILFFSIGASYFLLGLINTLKVVIGNLTYFFIEKLKNISQNKRFISFSGIIYGFSFLLIAVSIFTKSLMLFAFAIIISSISIVIYGESKLLFSVSSSKAYLIEKLTKYTLIITAISLFIAAYTMDKYPASGVQVLFGIFNTLVSFRIYGYLIVLEIAAVSFILAGYILLKLKKEPNIKSASANLQSSYNFFIKNKILLLLIIANMVIGLVQTIGYSYYGIFIYQNFNDILFGGFLNVAMVFLISVFTSLIGYFITKINAKVYRKFPILIFGVMMLAFMPFAYFFKPNLIFITIGTIIGVIGGSVVGVTNSLLAIELVNFDLRQAYFSFTNLMSIPLFLVMAPVLAYIAQIYGLSILFLLLTIILALIVIMLLTALIMFNKELA